MPDVTHSLIGDTDQDYKIHITPRSCDRDHEMIIDHVTTGIIIIDQVGAWLGIFKGKQSIL